jgi:hypothetical protein
MVENYHFYFQQLFSFQQLDPFRNGNHITRAHYIFMSFNGLDPAGVNFCRWYFEISSVKSSSTSSFYEIYMSDKSAVSVGAAGVCPWSILLFESGTKTTDFGSFWTKTLELCPATLSEASNIISNDRSISLFLQHTYGFLTYGCS